MFLFGFWELMAELYLWSWLLFGLLNQWVGCFKLIVLNVVPLCLMLIICKERNGRMFKGQGIF